MTNSSYLRNDFNIFIKFPNTRTHFEKIQEMSSFGIELAQGGGMNSLIAALGMPEKKQLPD